MKMFPRSWFKTHWQEILLGVFIAVYIVYFSIYTIVRYRALYANYFDLGIMHQTVYNTFRALQTLDFSRFLELTNPHGVDQIKRMAIHNDPFLALLAPLYFLYSGPEMLLVVQSIALGIGGLFIYLVGRIVLQHQKLNKTVSLSFAFAYLMYAPLQKMNQFDLHAVAFATPLLLALYYFFLKKQYWLVLLCAVLATLTKEQVGLTVGFFGLFFLTSFFKTKKEEKKPVLLSFVLLLGFVWFLLSMVKIIPYYRNGLHFALEYFSDFGGSTKYVFLGMINNPFLVFETIFRKESFDYLVLLLSPVGFLSLLSPLHLCIALPEILINMISKNAAMRTIYFQYSAVIIPFIFISALYGFARLEKAFIKKKWFVPVVLIGIFSCTLFVSYEYSPLFYSKTKEIDSFVMPAKESRDAFAWKKKLEDESIKIMASGNVAPLFASRRYLYNLSSSYELADYVVLTKDNVYNGYMSETAIPAYEALQKDNRFGMIYKKGNFEVYKKQ